MTNRNLVAKARAKLEGRGEINDFDRRTQPDHVESLIERLRLAYRGELSRECAATFRALLARVEELEAALSLLSKGLPHNPPHTGKAKADIAEGETYE